MFTHQIDQNQLFLTCETFDMKDESMTTSQNPNQNKLKISIEINKVLKALNEKTNI